MKKKYSSLRIASILLMLVLITSCVISGTFAKYTTSGSSSDSARVAKWGVVVNATGDEVVYDTILGAGNVNTKELDIVSSGSVNKIAPGTKGEFCKFEISGQPEVSVKILYTVTIEMDGWDVDGVFYCPLAISVNGRTPITGFTSEADFVEKVTKAVSGVQKAEVNLLKGTMAVEADREDIAQTILFLAGEQAHIITGQVIKVSGGHAL